MIILGYLFLFFYKKCVLRVLIRGLGEVHLVGTHKICSLVEICALSATMIKFVYELFHENIVCNARKGPLCPV